MEVLDVLLSFSSTYRTTNYDALRAVFAARSSRRPSERRVDDDSGDTGRIVRLFVGAADEVLIVE